MRTVVATRYVTPLREGGSLPAIVEADDEGMYVLKFRGAGQGPKALIAELVAGEIARALGLPVPEIVLVELDAELARTEPDPEIQDLIRASAGLNLALDYLPGAITFDPVVEQPDAALASRDRLVRRVRHQRRPHGAQHEHADVAPPPVADRSWRGAVLPSLVGRLPRAQPRSVSRGSRITCCCRRRARSPRSMRRCSARSTPTSSTHRRADSRRVARGDAPFADAERAPPCVCCVLLRPLEPPRAFVEEAIRARSRLL